jgi:DNA-binding NtrC family response regulator
MTTTDYYPVKVLAVSPAERDQTCLQRRLGHTSWSLLPAGTIAEALDAIEQHRIPVVVTRERLPDGGWKELLARIQSLPDAPELIVMGADNEGLWFDALNGGAYDVLPKPLQSSEVFRIISLAWQKWRAALKQSKAAASGGTKQ